MSEAAFQYPWDDPSQPEHVRKRQPVWNLTGPTIRIDLPRRRPAVELPRALQGVSYGAVLMTHRGNSNGRLSILLSSLPENLPVVVSSDSIDEHDVKLDRTVAEHHGADFVHHTPWDGRAGHAIQCMECTSWDYTLFLMDDVFLANHLTVDALRWARILEGHGVPLAALAIPGWELYHHWKDFGFESWQDSLDRPQLLEAAPTNPSFVRAPALWKNPFGACMLIVRKAYSDVGGFRRTYWANDDCFNSDVWLSNRWVNAAMPGPSYFHWGAQSAHFGEAPEWIGTFDAAMGMSAEESGRLQVESMLRWREKLGHIFLGLAGTESL
jgi:hypothetical protein